VLHLHARLNLGQLAGRLHALPGVGQVLFCGGCRRASLWRWPTAVAAGGPPAGLAALLEAAIALEVSAADPQLVLALPVAWARGLIGAGEAPPLAALAAAGARWLGLRHLPEDGGGAQSELALHLQLYRRLAGTADLLCAEALELLRLERLLQRRLAPGSLAGLERRPWPLDAWLSALPQDPEGVSADLVALLQLLPLPEQEPLVEALSARISAGLPADPSPWLRLLEALVGGINSRQPRLLHLAQRLRRQGLDAAAAGDDPGQRGLALMRLLQVDPGCSPLELGRLAAAIDALVLAIGAASAAGDRPQRRDLQRQLETVLRAAGPNLLLLRALVQALGPDTCYRLPTLQPPSACLPLLKGVLLLDSACVAGLEGAQRKAMVALVERTLPRIWWQRPLLLRLLHDLRRFPLELGWLQQEGLLLSGVELLHSRGVPPLPQPPDPQRAPLSDDHDPHELLRTQVLLLLRLLPPSDERAGLLRLAGAAGKPPLLRLLDRQDEEALVMAAAAGLPSRSVLLARLAAERSGVNELLPPLLAPAPLERAYAAILEHWRGCYGAEAGRERAPIAVVITTHAPAPHLLALVLESLALQTLWPEEIWLVDDGSPAPAAAALAELAAAGRRRLGLPLRLLRRPRNQGQYACRNLVLEVSNAQALAIQDDDDLSHPLRLALQWEALQQGRAAVYARHLRLDQADAAPQPDGVGGGFFGDGITTLLVGTATARQLGGFYPVRSRGDVEFRGRLERRFGAAQVQRLEQPLYLMRGATTTLSSRFEYGCSLALPRWRALMAREVLV
jgi:hypothetical protein